MFPFFLLLKKALLFLCQVDNTHLTDTNDAEAKQFAQSRHEYGIDLIAPTRADHTRQGQAKRGFNAASFPVDWAAQKVTCKAGQREFELDCYD